MNREIKFRVRNKKTKEIIGYEWIDNKGVWRHQYIGDETIFNNVFDIDGIEIIREQYTGLKDKDGKEIYEGDIVEFIGGCVDKLPLYHYGQYYDIGVKLKVTSLLSGFTLQKLTTSCKSPNLVGNIGNYDFWKYHCGFKVIGNIFENPELLGGK